MEVLHISCNKYTRNLPDMYALSPQASGIHIRQIPRAHVTTYTYIYKGSAYLKERYIDAVVYISCTESPCYKACKAKIKTIKLQMCHHAIVKQ